MSKNKFISQLVFFISFLIAILLGKRLLTLLLLDNWIDSYTIHILLLIGANSLMAIVSIYFIRKHDLSELAGITKRKVEKLSLLIFPLLYVPLINLLSIDTIPTINFFTNISLLTVYCISIGLAEELSIRGFIQSFIIKYLGTTHKNAFIAVFTSALIFGLLHLIKFDKGLYGEISQVFYATFIGVLFGVLLLITKRLYPLIIIHAIIDFAGKLDTIGHPFKETISKPWSFEDSIVTILFVLPYLIYALVLTKRHKLI